MFWGSLVFSAQAQENFPVNGVQDERSGRYAFTNATVVVTPTQTLQNATLLIEDGRIVAVGNNVTIPAGTITVSLEDRWVYPGFIDLFSDYGIPKLERKPSRRADPPQYDTETKGAYSWNEALRAEFSAAEAFTPDKSAAKELRKLGFGAVLAHRPDGISRGTGALISLTDEESRNSILIPEAASHLSFSKGSSTQEYPGSLMGSIALLRQTYLDADWYQKLNQKPYLDQSLVAFQRQKELPQIFEAGSVLNVLRADKVGDEFGEQYTIMGSGEEYRYLDALKASGATLIIPVNFPDAYDIEDPLDELNLSLADMKHWEMAPFNLKLLHEANIPFSVTAAELKDKSKFLTNLRKAVAYGLPKAQALQALTQTPARLINATDQLGTLEKGKWANFIITSGDLWEGDTKIYQNWVQGQRHELAEMPGSEMAGMYQLMVEGKSYNVKVSGAAQDTKFQLVENDTVNHAIKAQVSENLLNLYFNPTPKDTTSQRLYRLSGWPVGDSKNWQGTGRNEAGKLVNFSLNYQDKLPADTAKKQEIAEQKIPQPQDIIHPFVAYGQAQPLTAGNYLIQGATVWTNEEQGILEKADVLVQNGKIARVGQNLSAPAGGKVIDGTGLHLTSGIIDEHSHIAISGGVNEATQSVTSEVRIGDVVDSDDINIYRQLAGGVTVAHLLHGSANPIGGQNELIKLRWGKTPEQMKIEGADEYIKFALGENVKQSNWGPHYSVRFPQTRMGVEQVMVDAFTRARAYEKSWKEYNELSKREKAKAQAPRRDLELEALVEILNRKRFITSHSYVQSEINMLMKVAEQFGFTVNTFTHILEGYKLADKMAKHGAGGSTFADWWVYKFEVQEPYNAALMHSQGVVTAINSDDAEMARRLNQEAAKTVKYGGVSEEEAWKMVTLNPAKLLHLDDRMGSIKEGKDADLVLWSDNPLSIYAKPQWTMIDGVMYYDAERDEELRNQIERERARLVLALQEAKNGGQTTQKVQSKKAHIWHCEDFFTDSHQ